MIVARRFMPLVLALLAASCSARNDASLSIHLVYPGGQTGTAAAAGESAGTTRPLYALDNSNRILIRVLAPHISTPIERWFDRSAGRGEIGDIPAGDRIVVEVDEYDNTAVALPTTAKLLGRGWTQGISLVPGERKTVPVTMYDKGTIVRVCGAAPVAGDGVQGDSGDGGLAIDAKIGQPMAIKVDSGDSIYISSSFYNRLRKIDRFGYISHFGGSGAHGVLTNGLPVALAPIGAVYDIDIDRPGNIYVINLWQEIIKIDQSTGNISIKYGGQSYNSSVIPGLAVVSDNSVYYINGVDNIVFLVRDSTRYDYVVGNAPIQTQEGANRLYYPIIYPSGVSCVVGSSQVCFTDYGSNKIKYMSTVTDLVYTLVGCPILNVYYEGIDHLLMTPLMPVMVKYDEYNKKTFFTEFGLNQIKAIDSLGKVRTVAGSNGISGYTGDGNLATLATLRNPRSVSADSRGNLYIADTGNHAIRMVVGGALP